MTYSARQLLAQARAVTQARWQLRGASVGSRVRLYGRAAIEIHGSMVVHDRVQLVSTVAKLELVAAEDGVLEIGEQAFVNYGCSISASQLVRIGARCSIGTHCMLIDNGFHRLEPERRLERPPSQPIVLGENVWLGGRVIVLPGVTIGDDAAVGAGSVVTHDIPARSVAAGVPARVIREL